MPHLIHTFFAITQSFCERTKQINNSLGENLPPHKKN